MRSEVFCVRTEQKLVCTDCGEALRPELLELAVVLRDGCPLCGGRLAWFRQDRIQRTRQAGAVLKTVICDELHAPPGEQDMVSGEGKKTLAP